MLSEVAGERAALPLLAFAVSRLWEKRDPGGRSSRGRPTARSVGSGAPSPSTRRRPSSGSARSGHPRARDVPQPDHRAGDARRAASARSCSRSTSRRSALGDPARCEPAEPSGSGACDALVEADGYDEEGRAAAGATAGRDRPRVAPRTPGPGSCGGRRRTPTAPCFATSSGRPPSSGRTAGKPRICSGPGRRTRTSRSGASATRRRSPPPRTRSLRP